MDNFCSKSCRSRTKNILWIPEANGTEPSLLPPGEHDVVQGANTEVRDRTMNKEARDEDKNAGNADGGR